MFTGLIQYIGTIGSLRERAQGVELSIRVPEIAGALAIGESVAVDGCCLTVETRNAEAFTAFASPETLRKTSLGSRRAGMRVNLERALAMGDRLGGHMVSGHVDATGRIRGIAQRGDSWEIVVEAPASITGISIPKGSIAVDGISLTIVDLAEGSFSLWIIPETWRKTTLADRKAGDPVNLEADMVGKYVRRFLENSGLVKSGGAGLEDAVRRFAEGRGLGE